jgi:hypothetical protein
MGSAGVVEDSGLLGEVFHTALREGGADQVGGQILQGCPFTRLDTLAGEDVEPGMPPAAHHADEFLGDPAFAQEHLEHPVEEQLLQVLYVESGGDLTVIGDTRELAPIRKRRKF